MGTPRFRDAYIASAIAGSLVLLVFFVWHWINIAQVWTVLVEGAVGVAIAAAGIAWAWRRTREGGRLAPSWGGLAFGSVFAGGILLGEVLGLLRGPRPDPTSFVEGLRLVPPVLVPVLVVAAIGGHLAGSWRGTVAYALAGLVLLLYLGGSVMHRGGVGLGFGLFSILFPSYLAAGVLIGWLEPRIAQKQRSVVQGNFTK